MRRFFTWLIGLPLAIVAAVFAVSNRHLIDIDLWPLPFEVGLPLYLAVLGVLALGLVLGVLMGRLSAGTWRREAARQELKAEQAERELALEKSRAKVRDSRSGSASGSEQGAETARLAS